MVMKLEAVLFASILGLASAPAAQAFDFFTDTVTGDINDITNKTAFTHLLSLKAYDSYVGAGGTHAFTDLDTSVGITITTVLTARSGFALKTQNQAIDPLDPDVIVWSVTGTNILQFPATVLPVDTQTLINKGTNTVFAWDGVGDTNVYTSGAWAFTNNLTISRTNFYVVPSGNFATFNGADVIFTNVADSTSGFSPASTPFQTDRSNQELTTITIQFAFVPEANPVYVILPGLAIGGGFTILRRLRKNRKLTV